MARWLNGCIVPTRFLSSRGFLTVLTVGTILLLSTLLLFHFFTPTFAANCDTFDCSSPEECQRKIQECQQIISAYTPAQTKNKEQLAALDRQLSNLEKLIKSAETQIQKVEKEIFDREVALEYQKEVFNARVRSFYIRSRQLSPFLLFLASDSAVHLTRELSYRTVMANMDKTIITKISSDLVKLQEDKDKLEENRSWLAQNKESINKQAVFLRGEVEKVESYLGEISGKIASLTAKQQSLLAEKTGTFQTTVGEVPLADDPNSRPDYNPGFSPAYAVFSFGAPHFKGMSQYGAYGRAKTGQSAENILHAYYGDVEIKKDYDAGKQISVEGYGRMDIETYVKRIYEIPNSWGDEGGFEALKAQAVAARSYALAWTREGTGGAICTTQNCQVYKNANKGGKWEEAVNATRGWVLYKDGKIVSSWYASTSGGYQESYNALAYRHDGSSYMTPSLWDTPNGRNGWTSQAYEKTGGSPWFYKGWYKSRSGQSCGRSHPWLTAEEMADMVNAAVVYQNNKNNDEVISHIWQEDNCYPSGADVWSKAKMKEEAAKYDAGATSVNNVSATYSTGGVTSKLVFQTDRGGVEVEGLSFYKAFNRRAPGAIHLKSALFNIEKK